MIIALVWKEYREHRLAWLFMAATTTASFLAATWILAPKLFKPLFTGGHDFLNDTTAILGITITIVYGLVCGAIMFAGESEGGTLPFLDSLTRSRAWVWIAKVLIGAVFVVGQLVILHAVTRALELQPGTFYLAPLSWLQVTALFAVLSYVVGIFASTRCQTALAATGLGAVLLSLPIALTFRPFNTIFRETVFAPLALTLVPSCLLLLSALHFCRRDFRWSIAQPRLRLTRPQKVGDVGHSHVLLWLLYRQARWIVVLLVCMAISFGLILPYVPFFYAWPAILLLVGVICGTAMLQNDQRVDAVRFLGDQRFPVGRIWAAKVVFWLLFAISSAALMLVVATHTSPNLPPDSLMRGLVRFPLNSAAQWGAALTALLVYSFCIAHFFVLIFQKSSVAVIVSFFLSAFALSAWFFGGEGQDLTIWSVFVPPVFLVIGTGCSMRSWAAGRLGEWRSIARLTVCGLLALGWIFANDWYLRW